MEAQLQLDRDIIIGFQNDYPANSVVCRACYTDLLQLLNRLSYQKGGFVLHMLRQLLGDDDFFAGVQAYYARYRDDCALTPDLQIEFETAASMEAGELNWFFEQWIMRPGHPVLEGEWTYSDDSTSLSLRLDQVQAQWDTLFTFDVDVQVTTADGSVMTETVRMDAARRNRVELFAGQLTEAPVSVVLDPHTNLLFAGSSEISEANGAASVLPAIAGTIGAVSAILLTTWGCMKFNTKEAGTAGTNEAALLAAN